MLVENKLHGLSPALSEAIQSISRWELVQAALPHVLHCTATLLSNRNKLGWCTCISSPEHTIVLIHGNAHNNTHNSNLYYYFPRHLAHILI